MSNLGKEFLGFVYRLMMDSLWFGCGVYAVLTVFAHLPSDGWMLVASIMGALLGFTIFRQKKIKQYFAELRS